MYKVLLTIGHIFAFLMPYSLVGRLKAIYCILYTGYYKKTFRSFGEGSKIMPRVSNIVGGGISDVEKTVFWAEDYFLQHGTIIIINHLCRVQAYK